MADWAWWVLTQIRENRDSFGVLFFTEVAAIFAVAAVVLMMWFRVRPRVVIHQVHIRERPDESVLAIAMTVSVRNLLSYSIVSAKLSVYVDGWYEPFHIQVTDPNIIDRSRDFGDTTLMEFILPVHERITKDRLRKAVLELKLDNGTKHSEVFTSLGH